MISVIKDACIFMIIAQAVLLFVPGKAYVKYVRVLVGIIMILKITEPIFGLFLDEEQELEIRNKLVVLEEQLAFSGVETGLGDSGMSIYEGIGEELQNRLKECSSKYEVMGVELMGNEIIEGSGEKAVGGIERMIITVSEKNIVPKEKEIWIEPVSIAESQAGNSGQDQELKELYGSCLGVESGRIEIRYE